MDNRTENLSVMRLEDRIASCEPYCCCHGRTGVPTTRLAAITNDFQTSVPAFHAATKQIDKNVTMENGNSNVSDMEKTLYYLAIQQISVDPLMEVSFFF